MRFINIDKDSIPYKFDMTLAGDTFTFYVNYNTQGDFFTIGLYKNDEAVVLGEKLVYGRQLFLSYQYRDIPKIPIVPIDLAGNTERITFENMNKDVFLFLIDGDDNEILD